jgi:hypothetical protein
MAHPHEAKVIQQGFHRSRNIHSVYRRSQDDKIRFFKGGNSKSKGQLLVIVLVIIALLLGFITTYVIAMKSASDYSRKVFREMGGQPVQAAKAQ